MMHNAREPNVLSCKRFKLHQRHDGFEPLRLSAFPSGSVGKLLGSHGTSLWSLFHPHLKDMQGLEHDNA